MMKRYKYCIVISILLLSGCAPKVKLPKPISDKTKSKTVLFTDRPAFNSEIDEKYNLKPEPYSLSSHQKDPELLGPQSTIKNNPLAKNDSDIQESNIDDSSSKSNSSSEIVSEVYESDDTNKQSSSSSSMSKSQCISIIGESTFNSYVQKYGSESAALRRCALLSRLN